jgi:hypothetical protein
MPRIHSPDCASRLSAVYDYVTEAHNVLSVEQLMAAWSTQIRINEESARTGLGEG